MSKCFLVPVYNLKIGDYFRGQYKIDRVVFFSQKALREYLEKESEINVSEIFSNHFLPENINKYESIALVRSKKEDDTAALLNLVNDAIRILSFSLNLYVVDPINYSISIIDSNATSLNYFNIDLNDDSFSRKLEFVSRSPTLTLDQNWFEFHQTFFFHKFINLINNPKSKKSIGNSWKSTIFSAVKLIGQSIIMVDFQQGFLYNMIAFEMLLTKQGDKYSDVLPLRVEAFIGWTENWKTDKIFDRIKEVYRKRCEIVHNGNFDTVNTSDYEFILELNFILLWNIIEHIIYFPTKESLILFSEKIMAAKLLGLKETIIEPRSLKFLRSRTREVSFEELFKFL